MGGALGLNMTDYYEKLTFFNDAFWKVYFTPKARVRIALNSIQYRFSKLVVWVKRYVPRKCTTVIVVNWAKMGRSMKDRKFRVQSSLLRSLWSNLKAMQCITLKSKFIVSHIKVIQYLTLKRKDNSVSHT
jgi:hypothetical protein